MSLTIEFAGITTLLWHKDRQEASVVLVDLAAAGFHQHHAALASRGGRGIQCPDPDTSIAVPGQEMELGIWNLHGTNIELIADDGPLQVNDDPINATDPPPADSASIQWLPEIGQLCQSRTLAPGVPVSTRLHLKTGRISTTAAGHEQIRVAFDDNDKEIEGVPERYILPRFLVEIDCKRTILRLDHKRELIFDSEPHNITISNTCVCEPETRGMPGHFYAHYLLVEAKRKPRIRLSHRSGLRPPPRPAPFSWPGDPELCFCAYAMI